MAVFRGEPDTFERVDWALLQNGPINLYWRLSYLVEHVRWLENHGYEIHEFDCTRWKTEDAMHTDISLQLNFPNYYGRNLDALNDCLSELRVPAEGGCALVFRRYDLFASKSPNAAQHVLDIIADQSRMSLLLGLRLVALVQSDDPTINFEPVGATGVHWNPKEWLNRNRGL
jgi:RNAse (barnase) inhibitor barstar